MSSPVPSNIKLYHIVHIDRLSSIIHDGYLWSDATIHQKNNIGTNIGMNTIKERRINKTLASYTDLHVGECVPFYFCPRSVMLYLFYKDNHPDITYHGGQEPIIHLVADFDKVISWSNTNGKRWVFTDSNAGSYYFNDYNSLSELSKIDWNAVQTTDWQDCREKKQAEFLIENNLPFQFIESIIVYSHEQLQKVQDILKLSGHKPPVVINKNWYY
ncbi:MAG: hypothetical protein A2015_06155 [Spirochaetes bacterium GWF1_31_7]|nr:MAG: hypothetical protein A2Y30_04870 [Spirochaetes bacterium GWE1_32_154]OHD46638.1 MAG: hypothetical protein A2015_06155 [Spirochaetes bacterium GWF1_31_7]OHD52603.1 MAG: hypothetical protein A2Y29_04725 [Spirochaetes bacterium GWE2_31_10]OHD76790.1 MAG: hypothetical protein A2355_18570 [Spirochaetes bacterium RIFOXYB1_FULL_32_8]HBI36005.1 DUF4433 domain-containing protein [Spirochaetia bacterium]